MGCCVSSHDNDNDNGNKAIPKQSPLQNHPHALDFPCVFKPLPLAEEEAVKEVLSETPKPNTPSRVLDHQHTKPKLLLLTPEYPEQNLTTGYPDPSTPQAVSEESEMCSFSESVSTTTLQEEDDHQMYSKETTTCCVEVCQGMHKSHQRCGDNFSHIQLQKLQHYRNQARSPARRRTDPSPPRRTSLCPSAPRREFVGGNASSGRRSQPLGMRGNNVARSPSVTARGPSPGLVKVVQGPAEKEEEVGLRRESEKWQGPKESLENPLVSLECFIFL